MKPLRRCLGYYAGTCTDNKAGFSANLILILHSASSGTLHGELALCGGLDGGGLFRGTVSRRSIAFTTSEPSAQLVTEWQGRFVDNKLKGTYTVASHHPKFAAPGPPHQQGVWACSFVRALGGLQQSRSNLAWVFHAGRFDGPFKLDVFVQHVEAGRWPLTAVVALDDFTSWCSLTELLALVQSQAPGQPSEPPPASQPFLPDDTKNVVREFCLV